MTVQPIFLLSLPRAGSTLVQRVLAAHPEVSTRPEPWLLLPQVFALREEGPLTPYGHAAAARAIREFAAALPNGDADYVTELRRFVLSLYERAAGGQRTYFVDKTPRYHLIADELFDLFPEARWVFLWRNPLAVAASAVTTWGAGKWRPDRWRVDLLEGPRNLVSAYERHASQSFAIQYEELIANPMDAWPRLFHYLDLSFEPSLLDALPRVQLPARMGDRSGSSRYHTLSTEPLEKWKRVMDSPVRKSWCRSYLRHIGNDTLAAMGYDGRTLLAELEAVPIVLRRMGPDVANGTLGWMLWAGQRAAVRFFGPRRLLWSRRWPHEGHSLGQTSSP